MLVTAVGLASMARANTYQLSGPIVQRPAPTPGNFDFGYRGPQFVIGGFWQTSTDKYVCPTSQSLSNWVAVGDTADSADRAFSATSVGSGNQFKVSVTSWTTHKLFLRVAASCTTAPLEFPYNPPDCTQDPTNCLYPPGQYLPYWYGVFNAGAPGVAQYAGLIKRAFCWSAAYPGCASSGTKSTRRFALHDGTDTVSLTFRHSSGTRPPAVRLSGAAGCTVQRIGVAVENRSGTLRLVLRCRALRRGAAVRVRFVNPVRRSFRLRRGSGSIRVQLAKPPGTAQPLLYLGYGRAGKQCSNVSDHLILRSRTVDLRVRARCGRVAGNAVAYLYIGGLLG
jgi:hypothetical protein